MLNLTPDDIARFWASVDLPSSKSCWTWEGKTLAGFGAFEVDGLTYWATSVALQLSGREFRLPIRHTCENDLCVNTNHIEEGL
jgi:hypothetical protein